MKLSTNNDCPLISQEGRSPSGSNHSKKHRFVTMIQKLEHHRKSQAADLDNKKIKQLNQKQQIKKQSLRQAKLIHKNNDLSPKFNKSPFSIDKKIKNKHTTSMTKQNKSQLATKRHTEIIVDDRDMLIQKNKKNNVDAKLKQNLKPAQQKRVCSILEQKMKKRQKKVYNKQQLKAQKITPQEDDIKWLNDLVAQSEESFMWKNLQQRQFNIFNFIKNPNAAEFQSLRWILDKHYFCSQSFKTLGHKKSAFINRDISRLGRWNIQGRYKQIKKMGNNDDILNFDIEKLGFDELMLVGSGRLQPQILREYLDSNGIDMRNNQQTGELISYNREGHLFYKKNQNQRADDYIMNNFDKEIDEKFNKQSFLNQEEIKQTEISAELKNKINVIIRIQRELKQHGICDIDLHQKLESQKYRLMTEMTKSVVGNLGLLAERDKKIRMSKKNKSRKQRINNQYIINSVRNNKSANKVLQSKSRSNSKRPKI